MSESYTYAVARIRANELALFNDQAIEQLLAAKSYEEWALRFSKTTFAAAS